MLTSVDSANATFEEAATVLANVVPKPGSPVAFTINGAAPTASVTLPAALGAPSLVLLSDVNLLEGVLRKMLDVQTTAGLVTEV